MKNTLRVERAKMDLTQADLAKKVQVSRQTINAIEAGKYNPSTELALKLSYIFNKPVNEFFQLDLSDWL